MQEVRQRFLRWFQGFVRAISDIIAELAVRRDIVIGIKIQEIPSFFACRLLQDVKCVKFFVGQRCIQYAILFSLLHLL